MRAKYLAISLALGIGLVLALLSLMMVRPVVADGTTYYVNAATGSDVTGDGSSGNPWKTIGHAVNNVPAASTPSNPNVISVAAGTYDVSTNGETFPITMTNANVQLVGAGAGSTIINGEYTTRVISITAQGVTIEGFRIQNAIEDGILIGAGGVTVTNNVFDSINDAIDISADNTLSGGTFTWGDVAIISNTFTITNNAIYLDVGLDGQNTNTQVNLGDLDVLSNTFNLGSGGDGFYAQNYDVSHLDGGSLTVGDVTIAANEFYSGADGIYFDADFEYFTAILVSGGGMYITGNTFQSQSDDAVYVYFFNNTYWYSSTRGTYGDVVMRDNMVINAGGDGLHIEGHSYNRFFSDDASVVLGDVYIQDNVIDAGGNGIECWEYYATNLYDNASVSAGHTFIQSNTVDAGSYGVYGGPYDFGYTMYNRATATAGNTYITSNTITGTYGVYLYPYDVGVHMYGDAVTIIGETHIRNNDINATSSDGIYEYYEYVAYDLEDNAQLMMGDQYIADNTISGPDEGLYVEYYWYEVGTDSYGHSYAELPSFEITGNTFAVGGEGVYFYSYSNPDDNYDDAMVDMGGFLIDNNTFLSTTYGIDLYIEDVCEDCYNFSGAVIQDIVITNNEFYTLTSDAVYLYFDDIGYRFDEHGTVQMGDTVVADNVMDNIGGDGIYAYYDLSGENAATVTVGDLDIIRNQISNVTGDGIELDYEANADNYSLLTAGRTLVADNVIDGCSNDGVYADIDASADVYATLDLPATRIVSNTIVNCDDGLYLDGVNNDVTLINNVVESGGGYGLYVDSGATVDAIHNTIVSPTLGTGSGVYVVTGTVNLTNTLVANYATGLWNAGGLVGEDYGLFAGVTTDITGTVASGGNSLSGDAHFADAANDDYRIRYASDARDNGVNAGITVDRDGLARPQYDGYDIGAYEAGPPPAPPTLLMPDDGVTFYNTMVVTLTWAASSSPGVAGYLLNFNGTVIDVGNATSFGTGILGTGTVVLSTGTYTWSVAAYDALGNPSIFTDAWEFTVDKAADLEVSKTHVRSGDTVTFTVVVHNLGPSAADGAILYDDCPTTVTNVTWTCLAAGGASCAASGSGNTISETLTSLPANGVVTFTIAGTIALTNSVVNTATVMLPAGVTDNVSNNNTATARDYLVLLPLLYKSTTP